MAYNISFGKKAISELDDAYTWYKQISPETGKQFYAYFLSRLDEIGEHPQHFSPIKKRLKYRRAKIKRFPYLIVFRINESKQKVYILSIWHEKRNPGHLLKRLRN